MKNDKLVSQILVEVLAEFMELEDGQIWVRDQNVTIPPDGKLYITVGMIGVPMQVHNKSEIETRIEDGQPVVYEINSLQRLENIQIDLMSRTIEAQQRNWEVLAAMKSIAGRQAQEANSFRIFEQSYSVINTSDAEGGSQLNRITVTIPCYVWYKKEKALSATSGDYYDKFSTRVDDRKTIGTADGLIELYEDGS